MKYRNMNIEDQRKAFEGFFFKTNAYKRIQHHIDMRASGHHQELHSVFQRDDFNEDDYANETVQTSWESWLACAKSKQAGIDDLREQVTGQARTAQNQQAVIYELQDKIKEALERANHAHIGYGMLYAQFDDVIKILKSTKLKC